MTNPDTNDIPTPRTKLCSSCGENLPTASFGKNKSGRFGLQEWCKLCRSGYDCQIRSKTRVKQRESQRAWRARNPEKVREYVRGKVIVRDPAKNKARSALTKAVRNGVIIVPTQCAHCKKECRPDAHHYDYSKPLEVIWLCRSCHLTVHRSPYLTIPINELIEEQRKVS